LPRISGPTTGSGAASSNLPVERIKVLELGCPLDPNLLEDDIEGLRALSSVDSVSGSVLHVMQGTARRRLAPETKFRSYRLLLRLD
jgi:hypothetical protein